jgi:hypothetical protein
MSEGEVSTAVVEEPQPIQTEEEFLRSLGILPSDGRKKLRHAVDAYRQYLSANRLPNQPYLTWRRMRAMLAEAHGIPLLKRVPPIRDKNVPDKPKKKSSYVNRPQR